MSVRDDVLEFLREPARFAADVDDESIWLSGLDDFALPSIAAAHDRPLREAQEAAWRGLASNRAGLVLGPPGTGKTYLLSWMIAAHGPARQAASRPSRVLVTAFTKNAIGNVLDAVAKRQALHEPGAPRPIYYGSPPGAGLSDAVDCLDRGSEADLLQALEGGRTVVGATVWSIYRLLSSGIAQGADGLSAPLFDMICVDEASQMVLGHGLMALGALAPSGRVVVCGDDQQLPPVRASREIKVGGRELGGSLYAFLKSAEAAEFALEETFRLNAPLADFPERKFYPGRYIAAEPHTRLKLRDDWAQGLDLVTRSALDPNFPLVVVVHDGPSASTSNPFEASLAAGLASALAERIGDEGPVPAALFWSEHAAIVSPHRAQNAAIRQSLADGLRAGAFVETVDRIQGKERDAVILSYCVADPEFALAEGEFIFSPERLNVAVTRARSKLVLIISRRLLEAVPAEQETMDKAELLREFVFSCASVAETELTGPRGRRVPVEVRARGFAGETAELDLTDEPTTPEALPEMTPALEGVLQAIRHVVAGGQHQAAILSHVKRAMAAREEPYAEARALHLLGWVSLKQRESKHGPFWLAKPFDQPRRVYPLDLDAIRSRIGVVVREARTGRHAYYDEVRDRFAWMTPSREDALLPLLEELEREGLIQFGMAGNQVTLSMAQEEAETASEGLEPVPALSDADFELLNRLEDFEAKRINFGVSEAWTSVVELARLCGRSVDSTVEALSRLDANGFVMLAEDARVRSRLGELAREIRHVKQRFRSDDADRRPYLVRGLKIELKDRSKPKRDVALGDVFAPAAQEASDSERIALEGLQTALSSLWGEGAALAQFQQRGLAGILHAWRGDGCPTLAIAADTGSGKTEAACLPLIAGALADRLDGIAGTRAILAYPRIRLAANQAQRLASYLTALGAVPGLPLLTLGLQVGDVPDSFRTMHSRYAESWPKAGPNAFRFPFFACPSCGAPLVLKPGEGEGGADALVCTARDWRFDGWIGSKEQLWAQPPSLFLPTTDSLHQWMHDSRAGRLFGDDPKFAAPRALLADEIHLYTHIHGAQVALALQRLAARAKANDPGNRDPVAIGMSATIGDPARAWGRLIGRGEVEVIRPEASETNANPRGREYFLFVQPEVESRGADIAGASTTIQSLMCLGHGMRRRTGDEGGYRSLVFFDSIDKMRRLHGAYLDAEEKELASFRINAFGDDALGEPQSQCCGEPFGCGRFRDGECWWFAVNDARQWGATGRRISGRPLRIAPSPIYSGTSSNAEELIKGSDIVFATSSLEVGYDDPDIALVYQHYAPYNLASFVQRKGRGGRGVDDRPMTAVTLSIYSPRDSWWFRKPAEMVSPIAFEAPINPDNAFVRRGQALSALLDGIARFELRTGSSSLAADGRPAPEALREGADFAEEMFGRAIWSELGFADAPSFWAAAWKARGAGEPASYLTHLRASLPWAPDLLFETINLPALKVAGTDVLGGGREDVTLAFATAAPGNATRRYNPRVIHWRPPVQGSAPWLAPADYELADRSDLGARDSLLKALPLDSRASLAELETSLCRPTQITLERIGWMAGAYWNAEAGYAAGRAAPIGAKDDDSLPIRHDSRGELRGFILVTADKDRGRMLDAQPLSGVVSQIAAHAGEGARNEPSGLHVARVYWGADSEVRLDERGADPVPFAQTFVDPKSGKPLLHGYRVESEGLRIYADSAALDAFVAGTQTELEGDQPQRRWYAAQYTRYLVETGARAVGLNGYEARRGADLVVAAAGNPDLRVRLNHLLNFWSEPGIVELFEETRASLLHQHPLMTPSRVQRTARALGGQQFQQLIKNALASVKNPEAMAGYLRSLVLHSLALRLRQWIAHIGQADEGRLLMHVRLPIQFGDDSDDVITICEAGAHGDGTIRSVIGSWRDALDLFGSGFVGACPNAAEDAVLRRFWASSGRHDVWRSVDPRSASGLGSIAAELIPEAPQSPLPSLVLRILFDMESVEAEPFEVYEIASALHAVRFGAEAKAGRELLDWEFASAAVGAARDKQSDVLARLLAAYDAVEASSEGSLSPEARLADQAFRLATPLCVDGCRGCVHLNSDLMSDSLVPASVSRRLLQRFLRVGPH